MIAWRAALAALTLALIAVTVASSHGVFGLAINRREAWFLSFLVIGLALVAGTWRTTWRSAGVVAAAFILGSAAQLGLIVDDWFDTIRIRPKTFQLVMWAFLALQGIVAAWALSPKAARAEVLRNARVFGAWRLIAIAALVLLTSQSWIRILGGRTIGEVLAQAAATGLFFGLNIASFCALVARAPADGVLRLTAMLKAARKLDPFVPWIAAGWVVLASAAVALFAFQITPHVEDEVAYLLHAKLLAAGQIWAPAPPPPLVNELGFYLLDFQNGHWFPVTMPGWPAALALGVLVGPYWAVNPLLAGGATLCAHSFAGRVANRTTAHLVAVLMAASPWLIFTSGSLMPHALPLFLVAAAWLALNGAVRRRAFWPGLLAGALMGWLFLTRPLEGLTIGTVTGFATLLVCAKDRRLWAVVIAYVLGCLAVGALIFPYNVAFTGDALTTELGAYADRVMQAGANRFGFGPNIGPPGGWGGIDPLPGHSPIEALANFQHDLRLIQLDLFGWGGAGASLIPAFVFVFWGRWTRIDWAALAIILITVLPLTLYWYAGGFYIGARYWFMTFLPLIWFSARGLLAIRARFQMAEPAPDVSRLSFGVAALMAISVILFCSWRGTSHFYEFRGYHNDYRAIARSSAAKGAIVFVRANLEGDWGSALALNDILHLNRNGPLFLLDRGAAANAAAAAALPHSKVIHVGRAGPGEEAFEPRDNP